MNHPQTAGVHFAKQLARQFAGGVPLEQLGLRQAFAGEVADRLEGELEALRCQAGGGSSIRGRCPRRGHRRMVAAVQWGVLQPSSILASSK
jgi:hypothetical protein